jgi:hypothetical protein
MLLATDAHGSSGCCRLRLAGTLVPHWVFALITQLDFIAARRSPESG